MSRKKRERQAREKKKRKALEKARQRPISAYETKFVITAPKLDPRLSYIQGGY